MQVIPRSKIEMSECAKRTRYKGRVQQILLDFMSGSASVGELIVDPEHYSSSESARSSLRKSAQRLGIKCKVHIYGTRVFLEKEEV